MKCRNVKRDLVIQIARVAITSTLLLLVVSTSPGAELIPVGLAKLDITPDYPVRLSGYGNRRAESEGVAQHLWAKAIAIGGNEGDGPAVWIMYENCGLTPAIREHVATKLREKGAVKSDRIVISVTHSHTAPCLTGWAPFIFGTDMPAAHQQHIDQYTRELSDKLADVALAALANRQPSKLSWGSGRVGFAANRRVLKDGKWTGFGVQTDGPVDHSLPILAVHNEAGKLVGCVANYACHCTTLGGNFNKIAGDWAGYAQSAIESDHPGCVALITIGCGADANPEPRRDDLALCESHGRALADEVKRLLTSKLQSLTVSPSCKLGHIELPFERPKTQDEWTELTKASGATGYHAAQFLARLKAGEQLPRSISYPIATWTFGDDLAMVFLGGEVVVDYAIRMRTEYDSARLWITAYSNDVPCYIPSRRILREGGYEADRSMEYYARPNRFSEEVEDLIADAVQKLLPHRFYAASKQADFPPPKSPEESLAAIKVLEDWKVELIAAEPLLEDPVAFDWGPNGELWVAEMCDYPNGMAWDKPGDRLGVPGGRVRLLTDKDGNGRYDQSSLFLDNVPFPNGIKAWRKGVLISAAPDIFYAEDTDGDGRADKREILFTGFTEGNQQHRANSLRWGIDNWLYIANGDSGGRIKSAKTGTEVAINGRDVRIRPDDGAIETQSGQTQFGRCRDNWNNWFGGNNANPLWHYVLDDHYLRRNPHFAPPAVRRDVPEVPGAAPVFPASRTLARFNDFHTANRFTSACSPEIYRDERGQSALGPDGTQHVFICEPVHNLVHHEVISADGVSFRSRRAENEKDREFFASSDNWCRPSMVRTGPDGAIWIADMYRQVIEHPEWIPVSFQRKLDLRAGSDRGRIYRVSPAGAKELPAIPKLDKLETSALVRILEHPNGWQRDMAQQILLWRGDAQAVAGLERIVTSSESPLGRLHALCTLDGLGQLRPEIILAGLKDSHPGVRRHAVRLAEFQLNQSNPLSSAVAKLAADPDVTVRMQVAYSLGEWKDAAAGAALAAIANSDAKDEIVLAAVLSSANESNIGSLTAQLLNSQQPPTTLIQRLLATAFGLGNKGGVNRIVSTALQRSENSPWSERMTVAAGLLSAIRQRDAAAESVLDDETTKRFVAIAERARKIAADESAASGDRVVAVRMLGAQLTPMSSDVELLSSLLTPRLPTDLQSAVVAALTARFPREMPAKVLAGWRSHSPTLRAQILESLFSRPAATGEFVAAIERGDVPTSQVDARRRQQLLNHNDRQIRERAAKLLGAETITNRAQLVEQFLAATTRDGDLTRGKAAFGKRCAVCHKLEGAGQNVGPDLTALTDKSPRSLLVAMLDPNKAVEDKFLDYLATTVDGRQLTGMVTNETSNSVTLVGQEAKQITLQRNEIEVLQSSGKSLMPEGLEKDLSIQDFADVIAYVRSVSAPPKQFPGNHPELAHVRDDGSIRLLAMNAKIYGPKIVFEDKYRNLGYWQSPDDHAVWMMNVPKAGKYQVRVEYACEDDSAGDRFVIAIGDQTVGGVVTGTGSWDRYRGQSVGAVMLPAGYAELVIRSDGAIRSSLMDLRQIVLEPQ